jgi:hypothetical protein
MKLKFVEKFVRSIHFKPTISEEFLKIFYTGQLHGPEVNANCLLKKFLTDF